MDVQTDVPGLTGSLIRSYARQALAEDLGTGDVTTDLLVPTSLVVEASLVARADGVACGLTVARAVFLELDAALDVRLLVQDGDPIRAGDTLLTVGGAARPILSAERVALNFVGRLSGIASHARRFVAAVDGTGARILDTRKTTPGLRPLEKYAVRCGGAHNHRAGLYDGFMLKDNHRAALQRAGQDLVDAVRAARERLPVGVTVTVEVDDLDQLDQAVAAGADVVLLDNMHPEQLGAAVRRIDGAAVTEASGGMTLDSVRAAAESGVELISVGALTHSAPALDVGLEIAW